MQVTTSKHFRVEPIGRAVQGELLVLAAREPFQWQDESFNPQDLAEGHSVAFMW